MERLKNIKSTLIEWVQSETAKGKTCACLEDMGEVVDMIKDLAETEEKCIKAAYYSTIMDAMEGSEEHAHRYGYDNWRYSSGRFAPKGHGHRTSGYMPSFRGNVYLHDPNMDEHIRMGYSNPMDMGSKSGTHYDGYKDAKRHYTETNDLNAKHEMEEHASEHLYDAMETVSEIWKDAKPDVKKEFKEHMERLLKDIPTR